MSVRRSDKHHQTGTAESWRTLEEKKILTSCVCKVNSASSGSNNTRLVDPFEIDPSFLLGDNVQKEKVAPPNVDSGHTRVAV